MRQTGKNNRQRGRGRRNGNGQINRNTTLDSNGPDVRLRGNAQQLNEKYVALGNDASAAGERIQAEAYYQHADHYFRVHSAILAASEERREQRYHDSRQAPDPSPGAPVRQEAEVRQDAATEVKKEASETGEAEAASEEGSQDTPSDDDQQATL